MAGERGAALVTGAGRRIGRALSLALAEAGYDLALHHRDAAAECRALAEEIRALGRRAEPVKADLALETEAEALVPAAAAAVGPLTLLVNNASVFEDDRIETLTFESWREHMEVNLHAPVLLAQAFAAQAPPGSGAQIVNIVDQRVLKPDPRFFSYGLSKAALWAATRTLAQALAPHVRVNAIGPGPTLASVHQSAEAFEAEAAATPLGRAASPEDVAAAALYLIDARATTGQMIAVDAGQHLAWRTPDIPPDAPGEAPS